MKPYQPHENLIYGAEHWENETCRYCLRRHFSGHICLQKKAAIMTMTRQDLIDEARQTWKEITDSDGAESPLMQMLKGLCDALEAPVPVILYCPECALRHIDKGEFAEKPHHTHACQHCGHVWRPAIIATVGVKFLPGYKDKEDA